MLTYLVSNKKYQNIKEVLLAHFHISNRLLTKLKRENKIFLNGIPIYVTEKLSINDVIEVDIDFEEVSENIVPTPMDLNIIYEDNDMLIVNKQSGVPVHPSISHFKDSLSNGVQFYFQHKHLKRKIRPVNRLDKDTSGIVIFAKNEYIQECLIQQMKQKTFLKEYYAILEGHLEFPFGTIHAPIARKKDSIIEREVSKKGDVSITHYTVLQNFTLYFQPKINNNREHHLEIIYSFENSHKQHHYRDTRFFMKKQKNIKSPYSIGFSLKFSNAKDLCFVKFQLETGRTHQIRVHSRYIDHPILGDSLYGKKSFLMNRQALHAYKIAFIHPISRKQMYFEIDLPEDMQNAFDHKIP